MSIWMDIGRRQSGVMSGRQLLAAGMALRTVERLVHGGDLEREGSSGILQIPGWPRSWRQDVWREWLRAGDQAVVSHRTAAAIHRLDGFTNGPPRWEGPPGPIDISVPDSRHLWGPGIHRVRDLADSDTMLTPSGLFVTTPLRTLADVGVFADSDLLERAMECVLRRHDVSEKELWATIARLQGQGRRGPAALRRVVGRRRPGASATESDLETCLLQLTRRANMSDPERQREVCIDGRIIRVDFAWPPCRFGLEADGAETHGNRRALVYDLRRQNLLVGDGWVILRFTWEDVHLFPDQACETLRRIWTAMQLGPIAPQISGWREFA
jgi:very-short-patch-repair endonuclease